MVYDGRELIALRGYQNNSVSSETGASIYNKYVTELRYAISLNPSSTVYALSFIEAGNAWENFDNFNPFGVKRSVGFGVRNFENLAQGLREIKRVLKHGKRLIILETAVPSILRSLCH